MKVILRAIGKTDEDYLKQGVSIYENRLQHYHPFISEWLPDIKNTKNISPEIQKQKEGELLLKNLQIGDEVALLDENGKEMNSQEFSKFLQTRMNSGTRNLIFMIGGPYGFSEEVYQRSQFKLSLSRMTFSHQMVRLIFLEQLYRANTILKGEPYHHP